MKKLYTVRVEVEAMVIAEDDFEAQDIGYDALKEEIDNFDFRMVETQENPKNLARDWSEGSGCYHSGKEFITAGEALKMMKEKGGIETEEP